MSDCFRIGSASALAAGCALRFWAKESSPSSPRVQVISSCPRRGSEDGFPPTETFEQLGGVVVWGCSAHGAPVIPASNHIISAQAGI